MTFQELVKHYGRYLYIEDEYLLPVIFGSIFANRIDNLKVWMFVVAPSSSGKSEILMSLKGCQEIETLDDITSKGLVSHLNKAKGQREPSYFSTLKDKTIVIKDISPISEMFPTERSKLFSDLRAMYDGEFKRRSGAGETADSSMFGIIAGCTPSFERIRAFETALGERFLYFRPRVREWGKIHERVKENVGNMSKMRKFLNTVAKEFLDKTLTSITLSRPKYWDDIINYCEFLIRLRNATPRDMKGNVCVPTVEGEFPFRVSAILQGLYAGIVTLGYDEEYALKCVKRIIADTCPFTRSLILYGLCKGVKAQTAQEMSQEYGISLPTVYNMIEELNFLRFIDRKFSKTPGGSYRTTAIIIHPDTKRMVNEIFGEFPPTDFLVKKR